MKYSVMTLLALSLFFALPAFGQTRPGGKIRIACIGDSVTFGDGLKQRDQAYPGQLQKLLGDGYEVRNFGVNSMAVLKKADFSYFNNKAYKDALAFNPDIVIAQFGGNDSKTQNWPHKSEFLADYKELLDSFRNLPTKPRIIINTTSPAFVHKWNIADEVIVGEVIPQIQKTAFNEGLEIIDIHTALFGKGDLFPDKMHPGPEACTYIAKIVEGVLIFKDDPAFNIEKNLAAKNLTPRVTEYYGFRKLTFQNADGSSTSIVVPHRVAASRPIAWRAGMFGEQPQIDTALLQRGYHIVSVSSNEAKAWEAAQAFWKSNGLTGKITFVAFGGDAATGYNWSAAHSDSVSVIYADAPRFESDPDSKSLAALKNAGVALLHVYPDARRFKSAQDIEAAYKAEGGTVTYIKNEATFGPYSLPNPEPIVQFILDHNK